MNCINIGSDNGLSPIRRQAIIWSNAGLLSIGPLGTNFSEILIKMNNYSFKKMHFQMSSAKMVAILSRGRWVKLQPYLPGVNELTLTHWGWVTHICVGRLTIIDSDNGLSPGRHQAIIWTSAGPIGTNSSEIVIGIQTFSFKKMHLKVSSAKWRPFCLGLNVLMRSIVMAGGSRNLV